MYVKFVRCVCMFCYKITADLEQECSGYDLHKDTNLLLK